MRQRADLLPRFAAAYAHLRALPRRMRRALQRRWKQSLAGLALGLALGQSPALAATINVTASCALIDAITAANTDTATGGCVAGSGADTIVLPANSTQTLASVNNDTYGPTGLPVISSAITIEGQGSTIVRESGAPEFRILAVNDTGELTLNETTVSGGDVSGFTSEPTPQSRGSRGGGIANYGGTLTLTNSTISGNTAAEYGEYSSGGKGGGVYNGGTLTLIDSTITGNTVTCNCYFSGTSDGGGVYNVGLLTLTNSTISGNTATTTFNEGRSGGGGVSNSGTFTLIDSTITDNASTGRFGGTGGVANGGTLTLANSTIANNRAFDGTGGVSNGGTLTMTNSTIADNGSAYGAGGMSNGGTITMMNSTISGNGSELCAGGVFNLGTLTVTNSTVSGNTAYSGGGVSNNGTLTLTNSTVSGNTADREGGGMWNSARSTLTLVRTLVSGNTAPTGPEIYNDVNSGTTTADNYNLFGVNGNAGVEGFTPGPTDIVPGVQLTAILDPTLADNGGPTLTHNLVPGSPAIDAIPTSDPGCGGTDQRGVPRPQGAGCDIGAVEFTMEVVPLTVTIDIRPGLPANRLPLDSPEFSKPVAILSSETFDALTVDPVTVRFGATGMDAAPRHVTQKDVNGDGRPDLILRFRLGETGIECGDTEAFLTGETFEGQPIVGSDALTTVECQ